MNPLGWKIAGWFGKTGLHLVILAAACFCLWRASAEWRGIKADEIAARKDMATRLTNARNRGYEDGYKTGIARVYAWHLSGVITEQAKADTTYRANVQAMFGAMDRLESGLKASADNFSKGLQYAASLKNSDRGRVMCFDADSLRNFNEAIVSANTRISESPTLAAPAGQADSATGNN